MERNSMLGNIASFETMGLVDGPGVRFVVFLQGCPLRCAYCHNPEMWNPKEAKIQMTPEELVKKIKRYRVYFKDGGGVTISGGEPLLQAKFVTEVQNGLVIDGKSLKFSEFTEIWKRDYGSKELVPSTYKRYCRMLETRITLSGQILKFKDPYETILNSVMKYVPGYNNPFAESVFKKFFETIEKMSKSHVSFYLDKLS